LCHCRNHRVHLFLGCGREGALRKSSAGDQVASFLNTAEVGVHGAAGSTAQRAKGGEQLFATGARHIAPLDGETRYASGQGSQVNDLGVLQSVHVEGPGTWWLVCRLIVGDDQSQLLVWSRDDVNGDELTDAFRCGRTGVYRCFHGCRVTGEFDGYESGVRALRADEANCGRLEPRIGGFNGSYQAARFYEAKSLARQT
jgi:hypothetical protein